MRLNQVTVGCTDYAASVEFYTTLGLIQIVDAPPRYARFETPDGETLSIHQVDAVAASTTVVYFEIEELDQTVVILKSAGLRFLTDPVDESWGWREARLRDPAGNEICLFRGGHNRRFPPWRIDGKTKD
ncbi:MAG: glyoxalase/bleomycin resistance/extradiol dioxygenase family protein [Alphaproteobacteria bacterium HGW-Alphaproteobacteria-14]|nr:MAG: glyoxalase/bleomycin resistance/extradiol dioxygenase family protein [Alphaproteobacteria bacterium HGW-Alphaproteobacteria-14]